MQNQEKIIQMFNEIASTYDRANRVLSFGVDIVWRRKACEFVLRNQMNKELSIVDVACGTGDMVEIWQESAKKLGKSIVQIKGVDPSKEMLNVARTRFKNIEFIEALAQDLPLRDESIDILSISYGIRNVSDRKKALQEFSRVLKKNAICVVLEFTKRKKGGFIAFFRDFYLRKILPVIGGIISKNKAAYEYLPNSIEDFLSEDEFIMELESVGFKMLKFESFSFGISSMFVARKN